MKKSAELTVGRERRQIKFISWSDGGDHSGNDDCSVVGHAPRPKNVVFLGKYGKGRVPLLVQTEVTSLENESLGQVLHSRRPLRARLLELIGRAAREPLLLPLAYFLYYFIHIQVVEQTIRGDENNIAGVKSDGGWSDGEAGKRGRLGTISRRWRGGGEGGNWLTCAGI